ncbi:MAG TPA: hypothetical protein VFK69_12420 [Candidatus Eisenbacteria bacterium]|nr:hypothetical protein [Candidatus Eisenbacteria bacterium]
MRPRTRLLLALLLLGSTGCAASWHEINSHKAPVATHDDSLYQRLSRMPLDSLTVRQYDWLARERERREREEHDRRTANIVAPLVVISLLAVAIAVAYASALSRAWWL